VSRRGSPVVFVDADVIFAGAAAPSEQGASHVVLQMAELTLIECVSSEQAVTEAERNLAEKLPHKLPELRLLISRCLRVIADPAPEELLPYVGQADPKDLPILVAALRAGCPYLLTFNIQDYRPQTGTISIQRPGEYLATIRHLLTGLGARSEPEQGGR